MAVKVHIDREGEEIEERIYNVTDFDPTLVTDGRLARESNRRYGRQPLCAPIHVA